MATIAPVAEERAAADVKPIYENMKKNLGKVPNFFAMLAHKPEVLKAFLPFYQAITGPGAVEQKYKELAYLKTSTVNACEYWTKAHSASAKRIGITGEQIQALPFYERSNLFNEQEKAVIHFADQVTRAATTVRDADLAAMRKYFSEEQIVELVLVVATANFTNRVNDALLALPDLGWSPVRSLNLHRSIVIRSPDNNVSYGFSCMGAAGCLFYPTQLTWLTGS
jgi:uncharacterized peroxidase-related enzyme